MERLRITKLVRTKPKEAVNGPASNLHVGGGPRSIGQPVSVAPFVRDGRPGGGHGTRVGAAGGECSGGGSEAKDRFHRKQWWKRYVFTPSRSPHDANARGTKKAETPPDR